MTIIKIKDKRFNGYIDIDEIASVEKVDRFGGYYEIFMKGGHQIMTATDPFTAEHLDNREEPV